MELKCALRRLSLDWFLSIYPGARAKTANKAEILPTNKHIEADNLRIWVILGHYGRPEALSSGNSQKDCESTFETPRQQKC